MNKACILKFITFSRNDRQIDESLDFIYQISFKGFFPNKNAPIFV